MVVTSIFFWGLMVPNLLLLMSKRGALFSVREWWRLFRYWWVDPSALGRLINPVLGYFAKDFHPSKRGGAELLDAWKASLPSGTT
jgi:predicted metal-dependent hydrolase